MKKFVLLFALLTASIFAQYRYVYTVSDSLKAGDSIYTAKLDREFMYFSVTLRDTGSSIVDTVKLWGGIIRKNSVTYKVIDTLWVQIPVRSYVDYNTYSILSVPTALSGSSIPASFLALKPKLDLIKLELTNVQYLSTRRVQFTLEGFNE